MLKKTLGAAIALGLSSLCAADEGQWQPHQMPQLQKELTRAGIDISAKQLADLSQYPMNAIVSLGYCSASFVSPSGLVVTNHHCAYGAIQQNSTKDSNFIEKGFLAKTLAEELPAGPQERLYITEQVLDVTSQVVSGLDGLSGAARYEAIEARRKALLKECESEPYYRCSVASFHHGMQYFQIKQLMIQDVRLVHAPAESVGAFGGDIDNFEYPRHTGDYAFLRGYVGKDGKPAPFAKDNVPYQPASFLKVNASGVREGDGILLAGYPGQTSRYRLADEISFASNWQYPTQVATFSQMISTIERLSEQDADLKVKYASVVKGMHNRMKKLQGLLDGFKVTDIHAIKHTQEQALRAWIQADASRSEYQHSVDALAALMEKEHAFVKQNYYFGQAKRSDLLSAAITLHRLALESQKPNEEREMGYQERDLPMIQARLARLERSYAQVMDSELWSEQLFVYLAQPVSLRVPALDRALGLTEGLSQAELKAKLLPLYQKSQLATTQGRLAWLGKSVEEFNKSEDAFIQLAVALSEQNLALELQEKELKGQLSVVRPAFMQAIIAYNQAQGKPVYPDANGTLRITYGTVDGYPAKDGVYKTPFTSVKGLIAKRTELYPFDAPLALLTAYQQGKTEGYYYADLSAVKKSPWYCAIFSCERAKTTKFDSVPVNFLSSADTTGGNSGSAVMNGRGELVGLNFDSTYESITKDWYFNPEITRAIHVDVRFMLWMMQSVDGAENLLKEMTVVRH